jgi:DNA ligase-1
MKRFAELYARLDATNKTNQKLAALRDYFAAAPPADAAWAVYFLSERKLKRLVTSTHLARWGVQLSGVPEWLFEESYHAVGDLAEALALLLPPPGEALDWPLHRCVEESLLRLRDLDEAGREAVVKRAWQGMDTGQRLVWNKLITGSFRVGVSQRLVVRALADHSGLPADVVAHRLMGDWEPTAEFYGRILAAEDEAAAVSRPYPFFLAHALEGDPAALGPLEQWQAEWKWDGIRAQLMRRQGAIYLWSRGEELVTERFPEVTAEAASLPDGTVLDGEVVAWKDGAVLPFAELQKRITR